MLQEITYNYRNQYTKNYLLKEIISRTYVGTQWRGSNLFGAYTNKNCSAKTVVDKTMKSEWKVETKIKKNKGKSGEN